MSDTIFLQAQQDSETQSSHLAEPETPPKAGSGQTAQSTPVQPPPGFSPNHLFGDADEEPMDFAASLSFLDETEQVDLYSLIPMSILVYQNSMTACYGFIPTCPNVYNFTPFRPRVAPVYPLIGSDFHPLQLG